MPSLPGSGLRPPSPRPLACHGAARDRRCRAELLGHGTDRRSGQFLTSHLLSSSSPRNIFSRDFSLKRHAPSLLPPGPQGREDAPPRLPPPPVRQPLPSPSPPDSSISSRNLSLIATWFGSRSGSTTLSASAVLLPPGALAEPPPPLLGRVCAAHGHTGGVALTSASLVEPFLVAEQRDSASEVGCVVSCSQLCN